MLRPAARCRKHFVRDVCRCVRSETTTVERVSDSTAWPELSEVWIPVGVPGYSGASKAHRQAVLDGRFGADGWRYAHYVRGRVVPMAEAKAKKEGEKK